MAIYSNNSIIQRAIISVKYMLNYFTIISKIDFVIMIRVVPRQDFRTRHGRTKKYRKGGKPLLDRCTNDFSPKRKKSPNLR